jgi:2-polyprenyl-3-methyl-5-hydroxy-6-metoxy-1,4-benzoquinol methylase
LSSVPGSSGAIKGALRIFDTRYSKYLPIDRSARIVEIGCGDGTFVSYLLSKGFNRVEGVDSSSEQVEAARNMGRHQVILADNCERLEQIKGQMDMVVALDVIEHYNKRELLTLLDAVYGSLKDTGIFLVQTPNADGPFGARHRYSDFTHELAFTPYSLSQALRMAGFKEIECTPVEPIIHGIASLIRWCAWKAIRLLLVTYLAVETGCFHGHVLTQNMIARARK